jgi:hypothetical protein
MTPAEAQVLLSMCATVDNRKPDEDAARAWAAMLDGLRFDDCRIAVVEHYKTSTDWLMPAKVRADVKRIRAKRIAEHPPVTPPADLEDYAAWHREIYGRIGNGERIDPDYAYAGQLVKRDVRALMSTPTDQRHDDEGASNG